MFDRVYERELPDMQDWSQALLDEAIRCKVLFGVLVLGQGMVTARMVRATASSKVAMMRVTYDPRGKMIDVDYPAEMRYISEIRHPANSFSLMRPNSGGRNPATVQAARRLLARSKAAEKPNKAGGTKRFLRMADDTARRA